MRKQATQTYKFCGAWGAAEMAEENFESGGADRDRTCDLLIANETLYQLSYDPNQFNASYLQRLQDQH